MAQHPKVGFVGLGNMGWPMAGHLHEGGVPLLVFDSAPDRAAKFVAEVGGRAASDLPTLARGSDIVITMLPNGDVVRSVVMGADSDGLIAGLQAGTLVADMGSSDPRVYPQLAAAIEDRGADLVDAPVSGAVTGAKAATLTIMSGGDGALIDRLEPLFALMGRTVFRTGALGTGQAMKALNNLASAGAFLLTLEILLTGQRFGLDPALMTRVLNVSTGRNNSTDKKILPHVLSRKFDSGFGLALMAKDLTTAHGLTEATATPSIFAGPTLEAARAALAELGPDADHTAIARWLEKRVGEELQAAPETD